jgi:Peptidase family M23
VLSPRRTLARLVLAASAVALVIPAQAAQASYADTPYSLTTVTVPMHFPVLGPTSYADTYLVCRDGCARKHFGQDLMGPKMRPLLAAFNGYVSSVKRESYIGEGNYVTVTGDNGWSAMYLHVNNDTPGTDDGKGTANYAFAPGIRPGKRVFAGELLGWSGDSGNAESTGPHLHFELRKGDSWGGTVYNAFSSLNHAFHDARPTTSGPHPEGTYVRACSTCATYRVSNGKKRYVSPDVATHLRLDPRTVVPVTANEVYHYPTGVPVALPGGRAYKAPSGAVWFVVDGRRYPVADPAALTALGIAATRVRSTTDAALKTVAVAPSTAVLSTGIFYNGALLKVPGVSGAYWYVSGGVRHLVDDTTTLLSRGLYTLDAITMPDATDPLTLPPLGSRLTLADGALVMDSLHHFFEVTGGVRRPFPPTQAARLMTMYGWANVLRQAPSSAILKRLTTGVALP